MAVAVDVSNDWMILRRTLHLSTQGKGSVVVRVSISISLVFGKMCIAVWYIMTPQHSEFGSGTRFSVLKCVYMIRGRDDHDKISLNKFRHNGLNPMGPVSRCWDFF